MDTSIKPFKISVPDQVIQDLNARLDNARLPEKELVTDLSQGLPFEQLRRLIDYWRNEYDWRRCESKLNAYPQFTTSIDGLDIHFLHIQSEHTDAMPLLLTHGWPGSVVEFLKIIEPLTKPELHGGDAKDAFHLVIPSLPGFGFSAKPEQPGWGVERIAKAWSELMKKLGYSKYVAQGGDWGAIVTTQLGVLRPDELAGIHLNLPLVLPEELPTEFSEAEGKMMEAIAYYQRWGAGYSTQQMSRPQTVGYALADSPVGQAAWIYEKFAEWADCDGNPENVFTLDELLDNIMLYWIPNTAASSARLYWESFDNVFFARNLELPTACSIFPKDIYAAPKSWAEKCVHNLIYWNELDRGGHFAAFECPEAFVSELRASFKTLR
ncbi:epoxide hydrolase family protein [Marinobacter sp. NP-6]|uniref:epoxide hydrolase family protein n=1 Tax=Marinobacter sp. NP-6 TaxID=2488666 RepID=UPI001C8D54EF|nr:epoxide hydrolase family protein [Marinobacter sp. NP-6]